MSTDLNNAENGSGRFLPNTLALVAFTTLGTLISLLQMKLLANVLTREVFGLFASLRGFSFMLAMLAANGLPALLIRFLPLHESRRSVGSATRLSVFSLGAAAITAGALALVVHFFSDRMLGFVPESMFTGRLMFWFYVTTFGMTLKLVIYGGLNGLRRITRQVAVELLSLAAVLGVLFAARESLDIETIFKILGIAVLATDAVAMTLFAPMLFFARNGAHARSSEAGEGAAGGSERYASYWIGAAGLSLVAIAFSDFDRYLLSHVVMLEALALFHIASRLMKLANRILTVPNIAFQPEVTRLYARGQEERIVTSTKVILKFNTILALLATAGIIAFSRELILVLSNRDYLGARSVLVLFALSIPLTTVTAPLTTVMKALDQIRGAFYCDLVWALSYVTMLFVLGSAWGVVGVGVAHLGACLLQSSLAVRISKLELGRDFFLPMIGKLAVSAAGFLVSCMILHFAGSRFAFGGALTAAKVVLFIASAVFFVRLLRTAGFFSSLERDALLDILARRRLAPLARLLVW
jgi:O-antigen/teichoic acid export membrane protein